jgi:hypothetical protein
MDRSQLSQERGFEMVADAVTIFPATLSSFENMHSRRNT